MNPNHRDTVVFMRYALGRFERDMSVLSSQSGKERAPAPALQVFLPTARSAG